jgi:hypothetical protein
MIQTNVRVNRRGATSRNRCERSGSRACAAYSHIIKPPMSSAEKFLPTATCSDANISSADTIRGFMAVDHPPLGANREPSVNHPLLGS